MRNRFIADRSEGERIKQEVKFRELFPQALCQKCGYWLTSRQLAYRGQTGRLVVTQSTCVLNHLGPKMNLHPTWGQK